MLILILILILILLLTLMLILIQYSSSSCYSCSCSCSCSPSLATLLGPWAHSSAVSPSLTFSLCAPSWVGPSPFFLLASPPSPRRRLRDWPAPGESTCSRPCALSSAFAGCEQARNACTGGRGGGRDRDIRRICEMTWSITRQNTTRQTKTNCPKTK